MAFCGQQSFKLPISYIYIYLAVSKRFIPNVLELRKLLMIKRLIIQKFLQGSNSK